MFFEKKKDAIMWCKLETIKTHRQHHVVRCKKYLCPPKKYLGRDYVNGYTVVLGRGV